MFFLNTWAEHKLRRLMMLVSSGFILSSTALATPTPAAAANPAFTTSASVSASTVAPAQTETVTWSVKSDAAAKVLVNLGLYDSSWKAVGQQFFSNESFTAGQTKTYTENWVVPIGEALGTHTAQVSVFSPDWSINYSRNSAASQFSVANPAYTSSASVSASTIAPGQTETISWSVKSDTTANVLVNLGLYDSSWKAVGQQFFSNESFAAGQTKTYTENWIVPAGEVLGTHTAQVSVFSPDWSINYSRNASAGQFSVGNPAAAPPTACSQSLQSQIDAAVAGSTVNVPACIYREAVTIGKQLTLVGQPGAEIRGSDVWVKWAPSGSYWLQGPLSNPAGAQGPCEAGYPSCNWSGQVFMDARLLTQVGANPTSGQWTMDAKSNVVLADNPTGHVLEVTVRKSWMHVLADNVTVQGFAMQHAANDPDTGALMSDDFSNFTAQNNTLSYAHGADVAVRSGSGHKIINNDIHHGGQLGLMAYNAGGILVQGNRIHDNSIGGFDPAWGAGGLKVSSLKDATLDLNEVYANHGPGLWADVNCQTVSFSNNRVHDNTGMGIVFEVSNGAKIFGNAVWNNSMGDGGGWGSDIFIASSSNAEIYNNTVSADKTHGILVVSQSRSDYPAAATVVGNNVHDNTILMYNLYDNSIGRTGLGFLEDWSGTLYDAASNNRASNNQFWFSYPEASWARFSWGTAASGQMNLAQFTSTPAGHGTQYLTTVQRDQALAAANIPPTR